MKDAKITYKINRVGQVSTNHKSPNQCKSVGHKDFEYHAKVKVGPKLDDQGFVIDHLDIHKAIAATFEKGIASEMMCRDCAKAIVCSVCLGERGCCLSVRIQFILDSRL